MAPAPAPPAQGERFTAAEVLDAAVPRSLEAFKSLKSGSGGHRPWPLRQLPSPDIFRSLVQKAEPSVDFNALPIADFRARQIAHCQVRNTFDAAWGSLVRKQVGKTTHEVL